MCSPIEGFLKVLFMVGECHQKNLRRTAQQNMRSFFSDKVHDCV